MTVHRNDSSLNDNLLNQRFIEPTVYRTSNLSKILIWFNCRKTLLSRDHHTAMYSCSDNSLFKFFQVQSLFLPYFSIDW